MWPVCILPGSLSCHCAKPTRVQFFCAMCSEELSVLIYSKQIGDLAAFAAVAAVEFHLESHWKRDVGNAEHFNVVCFT